MDKLKVRALLVIVGVLGFTCPIATGQSAKPAAQGEWEKTIELAKKEGKVVVSIPASTGLRTAIERMFEKRYGIDVDAKWLNKMGVHAAKDSLTIEQFYKRENQSEEKIIRLREPAAALARKLLG